MRAWLRWPALSVGASGCALGLFLAIFIVETGGSAIGLIPSVAGVAAFAAPCMLAMSALCVIAWQILLARDRTRPWAQAAVFWPLALTAIYLALPYAATNAAAYLFLLSLGLSLSLFRGLHSSVFRIPPLVLRLAGPAVSLTALALYVRTLAPSVLGGDSAEAQFAPYVLGIMHYTGYPLYTLLGKLWTLIVPIGSVAYRMNLLSAVAAAATVWLVYESSFLLTRSRFAAVTGAFCLATSMLFWQWAVVAGVRSLSAFFPALCLWLALRWDQARRPRDLYALAAAVGLGLAHHRTLVFVLPALLVFVVWSDRHVLSPARISRVAPFLILPFLLYLYLPLRSAMGTAFDLSHPSTWDRFWDLVSGSGISGVLRLPLAQIPPRLGYLWGDGIVQFTVVGVLVGLAGGAVALWRWRRRGVLLLLCILGVCAFTINYNLWPDRLNTVYLIPALVPFSLWIAVAVASLLDLTCVATRRLPERFGSGGAALRWGATYLVGVAILLLPANALVGNFGHADMSADRTNERFARDVLALAEPSAIVLGDWDHGCNLWYWQLAEHQRQDLMVIPVDTIEQWLYWVEVAGRDHRPVYLARPIAEVGAKYPVSLTYPLYQPLPAPVLSAPSAGVVRFGDVLALRTFGVREDTGALVVDLEWQALRPMSINYNVSVRLVDDRGNIWAADDNQPVRSLRPTSRWQSGEIVRDSYTLVPLPGSPTGELRLVLGIYDPNGLRHLAPTPNTPDSDWATLEPVTLTSSSQRVSVRFPARTNVADIVELLGYEINSVDFNPGSTVFLTVFWRALRNSPSSAQVEVSLADGGGTSTTLYRAPIGGSVEGWREGQVVRQQFALRLPDNAPIGQFKVTLTGEDAEGRGLPVLGRWLLVRPGPMLEVPVSIWPK